MQEALEERLTSFLMTTRLNNRESAHPAIFMYNRTTSARMNAANIFSLRTRGHGLQLELLEKSGYAPDPKRGLIWEVCARAND
jgi:hypothetical protein